MEPARRFLPLGLASAIVLACATDSQPPERSVLASNLAQTLLILPLNVTAVMPPEIESLSPAVWQELEQYLTAQDKKLKTVAFADARRLWLESVRRARSGEKGRRAGFDDAAHLLVLELSHYADFDIVIIPTLFIQQATISGRQAAWDGVEREVEFEASSREAKMIVASAPVEGAAPAVSLHAVVLDAEGNKLQEAQGGLDLLVGVRVTASADSSRSPTFAYTTRTDPLSNREHLREGIATALAPFLPPLPEETK